MRHKIKKTKVQGGKDANKMLLRKLAFNFLSHGKITTTEKKAKILKQYLEQIIEKMKKNTEANRNVLLGTLAKPRFIDKLFVQVGASFTDRTGGYVSMEKLHERDSDGAQMIRAQWIVPPKINEVVEEKKTTVTKDKSRKK